MTVRFLVSIVLVGAADVASAQSASTSGVCPGPITIDVQNLTPNGQFALLTGQAGGNDVVPAGPCAGTPTQLSNLALRATGALNGGGDASRTPNVPNGACTQELQVLDVSSCQLTPPIALGTACGNANTGVPNVGPAGQMPDPAFFGVSVSAIVTGGDAEDLTFTSPALGQVPDSASLVFTFLDATFAEQCQIRYDLSSATTDNAFTTDAGTPFVDALQLGLTGGESTCGNVNAATFGTTDLRVFLAQTDWSVAFGPLQGQFAQDLESAVVGSGQNFAADWEPFVFTNYVGQTGTPAFELSYAFSFAHTCDEVALDAAGQLLGALNAPNGPLDAYVQTQPFLVFQL